MATYESKLCITVEAGADLSADQFKFVDVASDGQVDVVSSAGGAAIGVLQNDPSAAGRAATVCFAGVTKVIAGATITAGDKIQSTASGTADVALTADEVLGVAMTGGASGEVISVLLVSNHIL